MGKNKKKRRFRFLNRPVKIGASFAGVGVGLEFGSADILAILSDHPEYIFWLEVIKYGVYVIGILFAAGGIFNQAKQDLESIKIGEAVKNGVEKIETLEAMPEDTVEDEKLEKENMIGEAIGLAKKFFSKRKKK